MVEVRGGHLHKERQEEGQAAAATATISHMTQMGLACVGICTYLHSTLDPDEIAYKLILLILLQAYVHIVTVQLLECINVILHPSPIELIPPIRLVCNCAACTVPACTAPHDN